MKKVLTCLLCALSCLPALAQSAKPAPFALHADDRIVLLGSTIIEREQKYGYLETQLVLAAGDKKIHVRNLGWSGDTVFGHARSYFGPPTEGIERLTKHIDLTKPTVLVTCYGAEIPFEGLDEIPAFIQGYTALLDLVRAKSPGLRVIIIAPPPFENLGSPLPDLSEANAKLAKVRDALQDFAGKQGANFVDLYTLMGGAKKERPTHPLTDDGLHYAQEGYKILAEKFIGALGLPVVPAGSAPVEALRSAIIEKDRLFFDRWRPQNETYLFGFRKHEQGKNAAEVDQFDPLIDAQENKIAQLKSAALNQIKLP